LDEKEKNLKIKLQAEGAVSNPRSQIISTLHLNRMMGGIKVSFNFKIQQKTLKTRINPRPTSTLLQDNDTRIMQCYENPHDPNLASESLTVRSDGWPV
jgi:hypothetical protein